ncbi:XTP/dITP diphosphohydrolase [Kytococcus aerolatus]|uniref:XTP/dITP diphosphohydrolase n=1 Tax=Kytococcus aerolatus TaxID=592308 RepID=A0A212U844_9MICO|nr:MazG nucleotide pyrophosphohydrolase domain-containing protein [Kytococcus aerolatus]SNC74320.1 XTP/dITP diphosphohydrolase [Kytococcus aerolatus]
MTAPGASLTRVVELMARLRGPEGCPWHREQTHESLAPYAVEEAHETREAIAEGDPDHLAEELGDLLWQVVVHAQLASEAGQFDIDDVVSTLEAKVLRRHPHVFDPAVPNVATAAEVYPIYRAAKARERAEQARDTQ